jgi:hypothetical protein
MVIIYLRKNENGIWLSSISRNKENCKKKQELQLIKNRQINEIINTKLDYNLLFFIINKEVFTNIFLKAKSLSVKNATPVRPQYSTV